MFNFSGPHIPVLTVPDIFPDVCVMMASTVHNAGTVSYIVLWDEEPYGMYFFVIM